MFVAASTNKNVIVAALAGNLAIAVTKLTAALFTGSAVMMSEAIHSAVDTGNQIIVLIGSGAPPARRPRALLSAMGRICVEAQSFASHAAVRAAVIAGGGAGALAYDVPAPSSPEATIRRGANLCRR